MDRSAALPAAKPCIAGWPSLRCMAAVLGWPAPVWTRLQLLACSWAHLEALTVGDSDRVAALPAFNVDCHIIASHKHGSCAGQLSALSWPHWLEITLWPPTMSS